MTSKLKGNATLQFNLAAKLIIASPLFCKPAVSANALWMKWINNKQVAEYNHENGVVQGVNNGVHVISRLSYVGCVSIQITELVVGFSSTC